MYLIYKAKFGGRLFAAFKLFVFVLIRRLLICVFLLVVIVFLKFY